MTYLLDTNTCIYIIKRKPPSVIERMRALVAEVIAVSTITVAEMEHGAAKSRDQNRNRIALLRFLLPFAILDFGQAAATHYGSIRKDLESRGTPIGPMDMLLAAQAKAEDLVLVTNNTKEFKRVAGLRVENWVRG